MTRRSRRCPSPVILLLATLAAAAPAAAQARDDGARIERVGDGVYAIVHENASDEWPHGNTGVIVGDDGVFVVDAAYLPSRARADIALIRTVTDKPVRYLAITHWHFDHNNGTVAYRDAFPGLTVVSERETARWIDLNATYWAKMSTAPASTRRASLAALEKRLALGADSAGQPPYTARVKDSLARVIRQRKGELEELATLTVIRPDLVFDRELTLQFGKRRIQLVNRGPANSPADVTIYLPDDRILFTGDILVHDPLPYPFGAWPVPWIGVLRELEGLPVAALVPGHGPVMRDHAYTRKVRQLMEAVTARVDSMARRGMPLDQVQDSMSLEDVRRGYRPWTDAPPDDWRQITRILIERAWKGVRGQG
ncbi:MAG TPA: MBL fold metallo-hydrolase [Gemmatimonadales bacterium]|nr:MBL fold metallo-hydrolase [Gemmatimonadales bacterium]